MTTDRPRRLAAATLLIAAITALAGCGTGFNAATGQQYQPAVGANERQGDVRLYNVLLVENPGGTYSLSAGILNTTDEPQLLTEATFTPLTADEQAADGPTAVEPEGDVSIPAGALLTLGPAGELAGLEIDDTEVGLYVVVTLTFEGAGSVTIEAPVVARTADYSGIAAEPSEGTDDGAVNDEAGQGTAPDGGQAEGTDPDETVVVD